MNKVLVLIAALAGLAALVAGCGSGGGSTTDSSTALTKADFLKQGNSICREGAEEINAGFEEFAKEKGLSQNKKPPQPVLDEAAETVLLPSISSQIDELRALGAPEGEEGEVDRMLTSAEEALEEAEEDPAAMSVGGPGPFARFTKEAKRYGLTACGEGG